MPKWQWRVRERTTSKRTNVLFWPSRRTRAGISCTRANVTRCTTCSVEVLEGEPEIRSCKCLCDRDVKLRLLMIVSSTGARGPGWKP